MADEVRYFSNGTEGQAWMAEHCNRCRHDHGTHRPEWDAEDGCPHVLSLVVGTADPVFIADTLSMPSGGELSTWACVEYTRCPCDRGPDDSGVPLPPVVDPNQSALFDADRLMPGVPRRVYLDEVPVEVRA